LSEARGHTFHGINERGGPASWEMIKAVNFQKRGRKRKTLPEIKRGRRGGKEINCPISASKKGGKPIYISKKEI